MRHYVYKIQWLMPVRAGWEFTEEQNLKDLFNLLKALGVKSLDTINFLNSDLKKIDSYNRMRQYCDSEAKTKTFQYIRKVLKENPEIKSIEILKK